MATLGLTNGEIFSELGHMAGISRVPGDWDLTTIADMDRILRSGRRRFLSAHKWRFLIDDYVVNTVAPISTGTVTIVAGVVTFAGASPLPLDAVSYVLAPAGGGVYSIESYDSPTVLTVDDKSLAAVAGSTFTLYKIKYDLPADFGGWEGPISVGNHDGRTLNETRNMPEYVVRAFANMERPRFDEPRTFSITSTPNSETGIATRQLVLYPLPDAVYVLSARYRITGGDTLDLADSVVVTDPIFTECYKESILAAAETMIFDKPGAHTQRFQELLQEAVRADKAMAGVRHGRPRNGRNSRPRNYDLIVGTVDMSSQQI